MRRLVATLALILAPLAGRAAPPDVATDIAPVGGLVAMVMQGLGTPAVILPPGAEPHHHSMRPSEAQALAQARLVVWIGPVLTPWLAGAIEGLADKAQRLTLSALPGTTRLPLRAGADLGQSLPNTTDPHMWLDPENARLWLDAIADALAEADPDNAARYRDNAARARAEIAATTAQIRAQLAPLRPLRFIAGHDSWHYFENRFGLTAAGALLDGEADRPNPARLFALRQLAAARNVHCVLAEPPANLDLIASVLDTAPVQVAEVSPLGTGLPQGPGLYPALLRSIANALAHCPPS